VRSKAEYDLEMDVAGPGEGRRHQRAETIRSIGHIKRLRLQQNSRSEMVLKSRERAVENAESEPALNSLRSETLDNVVHLRGANDSRHRGSPFDGPSVGLGF